MAYFVPEGREGELNLLFNPDLIWYISQAQPIAISYLSTAI